jgi:tRNASer (uridine44-2'-O)-methyltransferase
MSIDEPPSPLPTPTPFQLKKSGLREMTDQSPEQELNDVKKEPEHEQLDEMHIDSTTQEHILESELETSIDRKGDKFEPVDVKTSPLIDSGLPPELWTIVQSAPANFTSHYFLEVSRNLLENPNLTASHLSRAELSYQSFNDASFNPAATHPHELAGIIKHLKPDHQPLLIPGGVPGYTLEWTVVRKLIPRNPKLDASLLQTCHLFTSTQNVLINSQSQTSKTIKANRYLVIYLPHATDPEKIPFYHPKICGLAILYTYQPSAAPGTPLGTLSLYYNLFPERPLDNRMTRTALRMLEIIHKHSRGRMAGYKKRVHHDLVIPQKAFQDTYAYLKGKYAKPLIDAWVEVTPAEKHVFEDLGIAAFLIELWTDMYGGKAERVGEALTDASAYVNDEEKEKAEAAKEERRRANAQAQFPGFVDIGCGNGLLVWILNEEGWTGWGFDARRRKTWATFSQEYDAKLKEMLLVPEVLELTKGPEDGGEGPKTHNGIFPTGTFIVANHADELTIWTPLLAFLSESPFIAIPCCSHNFGGTRFRAPANIKSTTSTTSAPIQGTTATETTTTLEHPPPAKAAPKAKQATQSAYASFSAYVTRMTSLLNYKPEHEYLRIPSTRNFAILGREKERKGGLMGHQADKLDFVKEVVEREMGVDIQEVSRLWTDRGTGLQKCGKGGGH